jgi:hypothetical protein
MLDTVNWCYSDRVIRAEFSDVITFEEIEMALARCGELFEQVSHKLPIHVIFDISRYTGIESYITDMNQLKSLYAYRQNLTGGQFVLLDPSMHPLLRSIGSLAASLAQQKLLIVHTLESALQNINLLDNSLRRITQS